MRPAAAGRSSLLAIAAQPTDTPSRTVCGSCGAAGPLEPLFELPRPEAAVELNPATASFGVALADIATCRACGHRQLDPMPEQARLDSAYAEVGTLDYAAEGAGQRRTAAATLDFAERFVPRGRLLDVGAWLGFMVAEAGERGWDAVGIEPSAAAVDFARTRTGADVEVGSLGEVDLGERAFDLVHLGDVVEHLPDPAASLSEIHRLLRPGGLLVMALPDAGSRIARLMGPRWWSVIPTHVHYFDRVGIGSLMARTGFEPLAGRTAPKVFTVGYYLGRLSGYSPALGDAAVRVARAVGVADRLWGPDFRDRMLVAGRRI